VAINYDAIYDGEKDFFIPEEAINGRIPFCVFVRLAGKGLIYKFTIGKDKRLSWGSLGEDIANIFGGSIEDSAAIRGQAFTVAYHAWKSWQGDEEGWQGIMEAEGKPREQPPVRLPYKDY